MGAILTSFFSYLVKWIVYPAKYIAGIFAGSFDALGYYANLILAKLLNPLFDLVSAALDAAGIPAMATAFNSAFQGPLGYFAGYLLLPQGIAAIITAYFIRFAIRRLPFLG
ncbi:hypothetical protein [Methylomonas sp. TEB]|uniref:hypothetical protein n=1 Tax=Methylomonas sp. TEB TaxID=3398229 RepID=UPI0039F57DEF